ncbi:hypothetical protein C3O71_12760 [Cronobacter sakazakii]|uniref:hypothetical protein n=1 Tax=Cronobacter sakazakii TaxID=28141 RepID=UPI000CFD8DF0|nr:hypothetical protein [Cronobacter sakazakii]RRA27427.1 hypothetical protein C3O71_12760 [Cronobacter sakazakii]RRA45344.1 hypothetical protein C3O73_08995 [Cronobacter sakazakii]
MIYYVNDTLIKRTLLVCNNKNEARIYSTWANENWPGQVVRAEPHQYSEIDSGDALLAYFGFTIDSLVDAIFQILPARSQNINNVTLIKMLLRNPQLSKHQCCLRSDKHPTHYSRLSNTLGQYCQLTATISGGRSAMKLLRAVRGDI